jgi:hypothetical protein
MQQTDVRISALNHLAVQLQYQAQYTMRCRMLGAKVERVIFNLSHGQPPYHTPFCGGKRIAQLR